MTDANSTQDGEDHITIRYHNNPVLLLYIMFASLFFAERDGRRDLEDRQRLKDKTKKIKKSKSSSSLSRSPKIGRRVRPQEGSTNIKKHPTQANLVGGKVSTINLLQNISKDTPNIP